MRYPVEGVAMFDFFATENLSQIWIGKTLLDKNQKVVSGKFSLSATEIFLINMDVSLPIFNFE